MKMTGHINQQPTLYDMLVSIAIEALATHNIIQTIIIDNTNEDNLKKIESMLKDIDRDWSRDFEGTVEYEKLSDKNLFGLLYEVNSKGRTRRSSIDIFTASFSKYSILMLNRHRNITNVGRNVIRFLNWIVIPSSPEIMSNMVEDFYSEQIYPIAHPKFDWQIEPKGFSWITNGFNFRSFFIGVVGSTKVNENHKIYNLYLRITSDNKAAQIIIALRRYKNEHGHWPESLDDVKSSAPAELFVDPINNDSFVYKLTDDGFTLYSKGKNNIDDGGVRTIIFDPNVPRWPETKEDDILIWTPKNRKTTKKNSKENNT